MSDNYPDNIDSSSGWTDDTLFIDGNSGTFTYQEFESGEDDDFRVSWSSSTLAYASEIKFKIEITDDITVDVDIEVATFSGDFVQSISDYFNEDDNNELATWEFNGGNKHLIDEIDIDFNNVNGGTTTARGYQVFATGLVPDAIPLSAPADTVTNQAKAGTLSWGRPSNYGAITIDVYLRAGNDSFVDGDRVVIAGSRNLLSYNYSGLLNNTTYYWKVNGINSDGNTDSVTRSFTTAALPTKASIISPADLATGIDNNDTLRWTNGSNVTAVNLYLDTENPPTTKVLDNTLATSYNLSDLIANETPYYWRIDSINVINDIVTGDVWNFTTANFQKDNVMEDYDISLKTGGIPLSVSRITFPTVNTFGNDDPTYVINVILKSNITPIVNSFNPESAFHFNGNKFYFQQEGNRTYLDIGRAPRLVGFSTEVQPPVKGWSLDGYMTKKIDLFGYPLAMTENNYIILNYCTVNGCTSTVNDIEEYVVTLWGGQPLTVGRIGNNYYLVVTSSNIS